MTKKKTIPGKAPEAKEVGATEANPGAQGAKEVETTEANPAEQGAKEAETTEANPAEQGAKEAETTEANPAEQAYDKERAKEVFEMHTADEIYFTSDGTCFIEEQHARTHCQSLTDTKVLPVKRSEV